MGGYEVQTIEQGLFNEIIIIVKETICSLVVTKTVFIFYLFATGTVCVTPCPLVDSLRVIYKRERKKKVKEVTVEFPSPSQQVN